VGGTFESAPRYAGDALFKNLEYISENNPQSPMDDNEAEEAKLRESLIQKINSSGLGPMGLGGKTTVLDLRVVIRPTHIASLPTAINICCHSFRAAIIEI
jgi:fumarate hydratase subunit alpha